MMKSGLRNVFLTCGLAASLHGVASATPLPPETFADGSMFFVDASPVADWSAAESNAAIYGSPNYFASIRTRAENLAVFDLIQQYMGESALPSPNPNLYVDLRYFIGLRFITPIAPLSGSGAWSWVNGDPFFTGSLFVPGPTPATDTTAPIPWGVGFTSTPTFDAGAYIYCMTPNTTGTGAACNIANFRWGYAALNNTDVSGYTVMQTYVPLPATLGIVLAGLVGIAGLRRARA